MKNWSTFTKRILIHYHHYIPLKVYKITQSYILFAVIILISSTIQAQDTSTYTIRPLPLGIGFAFMGDEVTGGAGGKEVTVTTAEELLRYASSDNPYIINVVGTIELVRGIGSYRESNGEYFLGSNTTLRGIGTDATILYGGFKIWELENVIIQNLHFDGTFSGFVPSLENVPCNELPEGAHRYNHGPCLEIGEKGPSDVALDISEGSERIWITQNTFERYSDEVLRIKRESSYVTLSWNRFDDPITGKNGMMVLIGHSDNHMADIGRLKTTIHHNTFGSRDRQPRIRFGQVHILNNYYYNPHGIFNYGAAAQRDSEVVIEGNYFEGVGGRPWRTDVNSLPGYVDQRNNVLVGTFNAATRGTIGNEIFEPGDFYEFDVDDPSEIPTIVMAGVGAGNWDATAGETPVPGTSMTVSPAQLQVVEVNPVYHWTEAVLADHYQIQVSKSAGFGEEYLIADVTTETDGLVLTENLDPNTYYFWRVRAINASGAGGWSETITFLTKTTTNIEDPNSLPIEYTLNRNYPNPFNPSTTISFGLPESALVDLRVYDLLGQEVEVLINGNQYQAGHHTIRFDINLDSISSGLYLYRIIAQPLSGKPFSQTKSMMLLK